MQFGTLTGISEAGCAGGRVLGTHPRHRKVPLSALGTPARPGNPGDWQSAEHTRTTGMDVSGMEVEWIHPEELGGNVCFILSDISSTSIHTPPKAISLQEFVSHPSFFAVFAFLSVFS